MFFFLKCKFPILITPVSLILIQLSPSKEEIFPHFHSFYFPHQTRLILGDGVFVPRKSPILRVFRIHAFLLFLHELRDFLHTRDSGFPRAGHISIVYFFTEFLYWAKFYVQYFAIIHYKWMRTDVDEDVESAGPNLSN